MSQAGWAVPDAVHSQAWLQARQQDWQQWQQRQILFTRNQHGLQRGGHVLAPHAHQQQALLGQRQALGIHRQPRAAQGSAKPQQIDG